MVFFGLFYGLDLSINYNTLYNNKFLSLLHDNTIIYLPLLILIFIYNKINKKILYD